MLDSEAKVGTKRRRFPEMGPEIGLLFFFVLGAGLWANIGETRSNKSSSSSSAPISSSSSSSSSPSSSLSSSSSSSSVSSSPSGGIIEVTSVVNNVVRLPCNVSMKPEEEILLILWYKTGNATGPPIYTLDLRDSAPNHFINESIKNRASFNYSVQPPVLVISPVKRSDSGLYSCRADYKWVRTKGSTVRLNVIVPPRGMYIRDKTGQPVYAIAGPYNEHSDLNLTCIAENGRPPPSLLWYLNDNLIDDTYIVRGLKSNRSTVENELIVKNISEIYVDAVLTCQAVNSYYSSLPVSTSLRIDMNLKPRDVSITTEKQPLKEGTKADPVCISWGSKPPARISWFLNGKQIIKTRVVNSRDGNYSSGSFAFTPKSENDGGLLVCRAENPKFAGTYLEDVWKLDVHYPPKITLSSLDKGSFVIQGKTAVLKCSVASNPKAHTLIWFFNNKLLNENLDEGIQFQNSTLVIRGADARKHQGRYQCSAQNSEGIGFSKVFNLNVFYPPLCKSDQVNNHFELQFGNTLVIECLLDANPAENLTFQWRHYSSMSNLTRLLSNHIVSSRNHSTKSLLHFEPKTEEDIGLIYCSGNNGYGDQEPPCLFILKPPVGPPPSPRGCHLSNQTQHSFIISCKPGESRNLTPSSIPSSTKSPSSTFSSSSSWSSSPASSSSSPSPSSFLSSSSTTSTSPGTIYHLEVYDSKDQMLLLTMSSSEPVFRVVISDMKNTGRENTFRYALVIYASNGSGKSSFVQMTVEVKVQLMLNRIVSSSEIETSLGLEIPVGLVFLSLLAALGLFLVLCSRRSKRLQRARNEERHEEEGSPVGLTEERTSMDSGRKRREKEGDLHMDNDESQEDFLDKHIRDPERKSIPPDIIELKSLPYVTNLEIETNPGNDPPSPFYPQQDDRGPFRMSKENNAQRVFCVSTAV